MVQEPGRFDVGLAGWRYKVAHNPLGTVTNGPLASAPGKEFHPPTFIMLEIYGGQINIDRDFTLYYLVILFRLRKFSIISGWNFYFFLLQ